MFIYRRIPKGTSLVAAGGRCGGSGRRGFARVKMIPIQDRIEREEERSLCLPAPEGANGHQDHVALAEGLVDDRGAAGEGFTAIEGAREEHAARIGSEAEHDARAIRKGCAAASTASTASATTSSSSASGR